MALSASSTFEADPLALASASFASSSSIQVLSSSSPWLFFPPPCSAAPGVSCSASADVAVLKTRVKAMGLRPPDEQRSLKTHTS
eukprot:CAMPEP_0173458736 /NCGR_PEP_ID=MMETSP1357-20121228/60122_1 /TAXON_ID=77926 /ORGANISM="Hemiselmis rufescens, Strain PCC563" /LENGTH=83 /DNA_ID=CAMNT_0014426131 /DNA_START=115 /DNA_END=366 /DNA_ORIENTATION=-